MIHHTPEGARAKTGFNWSVNWAVRRFWFRVFYLQYDTATHLCTSWYFRFRIFKWPMFIFDKKISNVVDAFLWDRDLLLAQREIVEDHPYVSKYLSQFSENIKGVGSLPILMTELR